MTSFAFASTHHGVDRELDRAFGDDDRGGAEKTVLRVSGDEGGAGRVRGDAGGDGCAMRRVGGKTSNVFARRRVRRLGGRRARDGDR